METRKYTYLLCRVEYPLERGYRMEISPLPDWIHLVISDDKEGSKRLTVHSSIHMNKEVAVGPSYSSDFTDTEIIKDLSGEISRMFL